MSASLIGQVGMRAHHSGRLLVLLIFFALVWFWGVQFLDLVKRRFAEPNLKLVWAIALTFVPCFGPLLYVLVGRDQGTVE